MIMRIVIAAAICAAVANPAFAVESVSSKKERLAKNAQKVLVEANKAYEEKKWDDVIRLTTKALDDEKVEGDVANSAHQMRAIAYLTKEPKDCKNALVDLEEITKAKGTEDPTGSGFWGAKGSCEGELGVGDKGLASYGNAIKLDPTNATLYSGRCVTYYRAEKNPEALADCKKAAELDPKDVQSVKIVANVLHKMGRKQEALDEWKKVQKMSPNDEMANKVVPALTEELKRGQ